MRKFLILDKWICFVLHKKKHTFYFLKIHDFILDTIIYSKWQINRKSKLLKIVRIEFAAVPFLRKSYFHWICNHISLCLTLFREFASWAFSKRPAHKFKRVDHVVHLRTPFSDKSVRFIESLSFMCLYLICKNMRISKRLYEICKALSISVREMFSFLFTSLYFEKLCVICLVCLIHGWQVVISSVFYVYFVCFMCTFLSFSVTSSFTFNLNVLCNFCIIYVYKRRSY